VTNPADPALYYRLHLFICTNQRPEGHPRGSCARSGSEHLRDYLKARAKELALGDVRVNAAGCLDRCELGPVLVVYPEGIWYAVKTHQDIEDILKIHLQEGGRVQRLMLRPEDGPVKKA